MNHPSSPSQEYLRNAVLTATPEQLVMMLYDGAIRFATRGLEALKARDREATFNALERAQLIVLELHSGLRREVNPQIADQMGALYSFIYRRLVDANIHQDEQALEEALRILRYQRETWALVLEKLQKELPAGTRPAPVPDPHPSTGAVPARSAETPPDDDPPSAFVAEA